MTDDYRKTQNGLANIATRGLVDRTDPDGAFGQVLGMSGRPTPEMEILQPQGVHFRAPAGAEGAKLALGGESGSAVLVSASKRDELPIDPLLQEGEGGLHYAGTFKVFVAADGTVHLGGKYELLDVPDFIALASKTDQEIAALHTYISLLRTAIGTALTGNTAGNEAASSATFMSTTAVFPSAASVASEVVKAK